VAAFAELKLGFFCFVGLPEETNKQKSVKGVIKLGEQDWPTFHRFRMAFAFHSNDKDSWDLGPVDSELLTYACSIAPPALSSTNAFFSASSKSGRRVTADLLPEALR
jgi:hypothetical protein